MDFYNFYTGKEFEAYQYLGAHVWDGGTTFRTFAPAAQRVSVIGEFNGWTETPMNRVHDGNFWECTINDVGSDLMYKYRIYRQDGSFVDHADPYAFYSEMRPGTASKTYALGGYEFGDSKWLKNRKASYDKPVNIYEMHFGSWKKRGEGQEDWYTYEELAPILITYLKEHGYNYVEIMPLCEYPCDESWGYQDTGYFSPTSRYGKPEELKAFCLTGMSRKERLHAIVQSMDKFYYQYGGIQLVVIDGIADLVKSANDEAESVAVIDELYRLAGIYNTCILCVLHFVPNGLKLRGHLGSELQRKAATILSIEKDEEPTQSVVKALKVRDGSPLDVPLMLFAWDKAAGMHLYKGEKPREEKEKRKEKELVCVARDIFGRQTHITYIDLCEQLQQVLDVKERTAKSYVRFMRERDIIIKDPSNQSYFMIGLI